MDHQENELTLVRELVLAVKELVDLEQFDHGLEQADRTIWNS